MPQHTKQKRRKKLKTNAEDKENEHESDNSLISSLSAESPNARTLISDVLSEANKTLGHCDETFSAVGERLTSPDFSLYTNVMHSTGSHPVWIQHLLQDVHEIKTKVQKFDEIELSFKARVL